jgi:hypothetical protein
MEAKMRDQVHKTAQKDEDTTVTHLILLIGGGMFTGIGIINLYYSFGWAQGSWRATARVPMNADLSGIGFTGLDNISLLNVSSFSIPLLIVGVLMLVMSNATSWRKTGGY